jgi:hypothetical protein
MTTAPQAVTDRYVTNLINYGRNREFDIDSIARRKHEADDVVVGVYFEVSLLHTGGEDKGANRRLACGATISQAVRRALEKHGVTFR